MTASRGEMAEFLDALHRAVIDRDRTEVHRLLRRKAALRLPREVREEALALSAEKPESLRAPMRLLRFWYMHLQVSKQPGDDDSAPEQLPLELDVKAARASGSARAVRPVKAAAARRATPGK